MQLYSIYLATCLVNMKQYIGQIKKGRLKKRIREHLIDATNKNKKVAFHNAINKYGIENFTFEIIETNILEKDIDNREKYWIAYYNTYIHAKNSNGYNETLGGQGTHGYKFTNEDKQKISQAGFKYWVDLKRNKPDVYNEHCKRLKTNSLGIKRSPESRKKISMSKLGKAPWNKGLKGAQVAWNRGYSEYSAICQFDLNSGILINIFSNAPEAARYLKLNNTITCAGRILSVCRHNKGHAYNFIWRFKINYENCSMLTDAELLLEHKNPRARPIIQYDLNYNFVAEWESAAVYSKTITTDTKKQRHIAKAVNNVCNNKAKTYNKFVWKYKENDK